jgi:hypothetical protein
MDRKKKKDVTKILYLISAIYVVTIGLTVYFEWHPRFLRFALALVSIIVASYLFFDLATNK